RVGRRRPAGVRGEDGDERLLRAARPGGKGPAPAAAGGRRLGLRGRGRDAQALPEAVPPLPDPGRRGDRGTPPPARPAYQPPATTLVAPTGPPAIAVAGPQADTIVRPGTANAASPGFEEEERALLHRRLRVGSWLCLVGAAAVFGIAAARGQGWGDQDG